MRTIKSIGFMIIAAFVGFFLGSAINGAMEGAILFALITGFACTISAIESIKKN